MVAANTILPVMGVPMPKAFKWYGFFIIYRVNTQGIPVSTFAIGKAGAINAA